MTDAPLSSDGLPRWVSVCGSQAGRGALLALLTVAGGVTFLALSVLVFAIFRERFTVMDWAAAWGGLLVSSAGGLGLHAWTGAKAQAAAPPPAG